MMKILIADDFELLREDLCDTLGAQADMEVVGAAQSGALWELAKTYGASVDAIRSANDLTGDEIAAGEIVLIPM